MAEKAQNFKILKFYINAHFLFYICPLLILCVKDRICTRNSSLLISFFFIHINTVEIVQTI